jgi:hypothetical protein
MEGLNWENFLLPYLSYNIPHKYRFLPCEVTVGSVNIYIFWPCGVVRDR